MAEHSTVVPFPRGGVPPVVDRSLTQRWKHSELFHRGYVGVPVQFLHSYAHLKPSVTSGEALFIIHLMQFKWTAEAPFPSYKKLADQMGVSDKMVRRHAQSLEIKGYLKRCGRTGRTNQFELTPLFDALLDAHQAETVAG